VLRLIVEQRVMDDPIGYPDLLDAAFAEPDVEPETAIQDLSSRDSRWLGRVNDEFEAGFRLMQNRGPCVTVFGSARIRPASPLYELGRAVGQELAKAGYTVVTGGGPGLMEAANRGALEVGGTSIGLGITLNQFEPPNIYTSASIAFRYFFVRKVMLVKYASAFVLLPGGLGTLDEMFETLNLIQTKKMAPFPVILVGSTFWRGLVEWMRGALYKRKLVSPSAMEMFLLLDDPRAVVTEIDRWKETRDPAALEPSAVSSETQRRISA
jgi:uncharacterized protein (TIGR00730 family)